MTMTDQNVVSHLLDGMVKCRHCNAPMQITQQPEREALSYVCAVKDELCATPRIEAERFNRLVVYRAINAFLGPRNSARLLDILADEATGEGNG